MCVGAVQYLLMIWPYGFVYVCEIIVLCMVVCFRSFFSSHWSFNFQIKTIWLYVTILQFAQINTSAQNVLQR